MWMNSGLRIIPQGALKNKGIVDSGCSRHITGNKAYLAEYQDYNGGPVVFGEGSGGNHGGQLSNDASLSGNEDGLRLQSVYDLCVSLCK
ncbi:hypothetical protein Tco_1541028 [Tanacetum coccineum]